MATWVEMLEELKPHKGELVLEDFEVVRLMALEADEDDYYWVMKHPGGKIAWHSCVGGWIPLKGKISDEKYERLEHLWKLNEPFWDNKNDAKP